MDYRQEIEAGEQAETSEPDPLELDQPPKTMTCANCGKIYKLKRYYDLHLTSCKPVEVVPPKKPRTEDENETENSK
jgi:hypothetical protein